MINTEQLTTPADGRTDVDEHVPELAAAVGTNPPERSGPPAVSATQRTTSRLSSPGVTNVPTSTGVIDLSAERRPGMARLVRLELRKMTDTRSSRTLLVLTAAIGIGIDAIMLAMALTTDAHRFSFVDYINGAVLGLTFLLPSVVILLVTSEWSQRVTLTTFAAVPNRGRVLAAKLAGAIAVTLGSYVVTLGFAALANVAAGVFSGSPAVWDADLRWVGEYSLSFVYVALLAFGFAVVALNSAAALVGYYLAIFALPATIFSLSGMPRVSDVAAWIDPAAYATVQNDPSGSNWAHLAVSATIWVVIPLAVGIRRALNTEIK